MTDAGFFRGTNSEQDTRFSDKNKKLLRTMKFADVLSEKVDMKKVKLDTIKPWIATKITELLNLEDEVVVEYVFTQLEATINLTGFLNGKNAREFMRELWEYLVSAQANPLGIPEKFLEAKKLELRERELEQGRVSAAIRKTKDSISLLSGPAQKEDPKVSLEKKPLTDGRGPEVSRDESRKDEARKGSPARQQRRSPFRQRYRSPQRTFRKSPSPRRTNARRSGSRDGRRSPYQNRNGRRPSPPPYRRRTRSRSDSRSPKRMKTRGSPMAKRSRTPVRLTDIVKAAPVHRASSSSSPSPSPPVNRRPIPRPRNDRRSKSDRSSTASSHGTKKKSISPVPAEPVAPSGLNVVTSDGASRPVSGKSVTSVKSRDKAPDSPPNNSRNATAANRSRSPFVRRGRNNRSPPRYRKRSVSPPSTRQRSPSLVPQRRRSPSPIPLRRRSPSPAPSRRRSPSPAPRRRRSPSPPPRRRRSPSPPPQRRRSPDRRNRSPSPRSRPRKNGSPLPDRNKSYRPVDSSLARNGSPRRRSIEDSRAVKRDSSWDRTNGKTRVPSSDRDADKKISATKPEEVEIVARKSKSPVLQLSGGQSDNEESVKKAKKAKKDKKHKKHKKHRKEKKSSKKNISSDEESLDIEQKLRARALECMRKEDRKSS